MYICECFVVQYLNSLVISRGSSMHTCFTQDNYAVCESFLSSVVVGFPPPPPCYVGNFLKWSIETEIYLCILFMMSSPATHNSVCVLNIRLFLSTTIFNKLYTITLAHQPPPNSFYMCQIYFSVRRSHLCASFSSLLCYKNLVDQTIEKPNLVIRLVTDYEKLV